MCMLRLNKPLYEHVASDNSYCSHTPFPMTPNLQNDKSMVPGNGSPVLSSHLEASNSPLGSLHVQLQHLDKEK